MAVPIAGQMTKSAGQYAAGSMTAVACSASIPHSNGQAHRAGQWVNSCSSTSSAREAACADESVEWWHIVAPMYLDVLRVNAVTAEKAETTRRQLRVTFVSHLRTTEKKSDWLTDKVRIAQSDSRCAATFNHEYRRKNVNSYQRQWRYW
jgi:hypothetical protein